MDDSTFSPKNKEEPMLHCIRACNTILRNNRSKYYCDALKADGGGCEALFFIDVRSLFAKRANFNAQKIIDIKTCVFVEQL